MVESWDKKGDISVNTIGSRAHIVSGFVFLCVPDIFHLYIKENNLERSDRNAIKKHLKNWEDIGSVRGSDSLLAIFMKSLRGGHISSYQWLPD